MTAMFKKEFRTLLTNLIGPLMTGAVLAIIVLYFIFYNLIGWGSDMAAPMNAAAVLAITFAVPFLCMRTFAEETRTGTDQLYMTSPVPIGAIVLGKFFALAALLAIPTGIACLFPLILSPYGEVQYLYCYTAILGFYLYALMTVAISMFISTLTDNQFVAGIFSFLFILLGVVLGSAYQSIPVQPVRSFLQAVYDFGGRIENMLGGLFDWTSVVYFLSVTVLFLFLCTQSVLKRRYTLKKGSLSVGAYSLVLSLVMAGVAVALNVAAAMLPERVRTFDVTGNRLYSVTEPSAEIARNVAVPVKLYFLVSENDTYSKDTNVERLLEDYAHQSDRITLEYVDTVVNPQFYADYSDTPLSANSVVVVNEDTGRFKALEYNEMLQTEVDYSSFSQYVSGYDTEGQVTNALQYVTGGEDAMSTAYLTTGHGEQTFEKAFLNLFDRSGIQTKELNLQTTDGVPEDADMLVINAPALDFTAREQEQVLAYLEGGGNLLMVTSYRAADTPHLDAIMAFYNVKNARGIVIETDPNGYYFSGTDAAPYYIFPLVYEDEVTTGTTDASQGSVFVPMAQALTYDDADESVTHTQLLITSPESFLKTDLEDGSVTLREEDIPGEQTLGLKSVKTGSDGSASTAVFYTSAELFTESADSQVAKGMNSRLFGNTVNALADAEAVYVTVPVKSFMNRLSVRANAAIGWSLALIVLVFAIWIAGVIIWMRRRKL